MKKTVLAIALIFLTAASLQAQTGPGRDQGGMHGKKHRGDPMTHLVEALDLSDDQAQEVAVILEDSRAQHRAIQESVRDEHCAVRDNTHNELAAVLTEEQLADFENLQNQRKYHGGRQQGMPGFAKCDI
jgi:Spy/CpxP family protein refolding chaperone